MVVVGGSMDGDSDLSEHPDHLRVRPAARPVLDESPAWGRGPVKNRLDQPSTLDLLARDAETARVAAAHAEEQEQVEAHAAAERRRARHESLTVDAEARRNSVMAREQELLLKAAERFSAEAKQERLLHMGAAAATVLTFEGQGFSWGGEVLDTVRVHALTTLSLTQYVLRLCRLQSTWPARKMSSTSST